MITIREVDTKSTLRDFIQFPYELYRNNPYWVPMLRFQEMNMFDKTKNPSLQHCKTKLWVAYKDGQIAGRIAGIISEQYIEKWNKNSARFGWIEFIDDIEVTTSLIKIAETWAKENSMTEIHGPLGFTDLDPEGMLIYGFDKMGTNQTIYNYAYYPLHLEQLGYQKDVDWLEYEIPVPEKMPRNILKIAERVEKIQNVSVANFKSKEELLPYASQIFSLLNIAYKDLYGVVTLNEKQQEFYINQFFSLIIPEYVPVVIDSDKKIIAFIIAVPSLSVALQKSKGRLFPFGIFYLKSAMKKNKVVDLFLVAIQPEMQGKGINAILIRELWKTCIKNGIEAAITHPALQNNKKVHALWKSYKVKVIRRRRIYTKSLQ